VIPETLRLGCGIGNIQGWRDCMTSGNEGSEHWVHVGPSHCLAFSVLCFDVASWKHSIGEHVESRSCHLVKYSMVAKSHRRGEDKLLSTYCACSLANAHATRYVYPSSLVRLISALIALRLRRSPAPGSPNGCRTIPNTDWPPSPRARETSNK
jgi:hypothetical protein